jgi:hypothetical protein
MEGAASHRVLIDTDQTLERCMPPGRCDQMLSHRTPRAVCVALAQPPLPASRAGCRDESFFALCLGAARGGLEAFFSFPRRPAALLCTPGQQRPGTGWTMPTSPVL